MKLKDIYHHISAQTVALFDVITNQVHWRSDADDPDTVISFFGDREVSQLIPLDFQKLQITIK